MTEAQIHDPNVDDPNGYEHRFAEVNGIRHYAEEKGARWLTVRSS
jgi:hypothetical protein